MDGVALRSTLHITAEEDTPGTTRLILMGEVDSASVPHLRSRIRDVVAAGTTTLVLDLGGVSFLDAAGIGVLIGALRRLRERDGHLVLCRVPGPVRRVLDIAGLQGLLQPAAGEVPDIAEELPVPRTVEAVPPATGEPGTLAFWALPR